VRGAITTYDMSPVSPISGPVSRRRSLGNRKHGRPPFSCCDGYQQRRWGMSAKSSE